MARKTAKELRAERHSARQAELDAARRAIIEALDLHPAEAGFGAAYDVMILALRGLAGMLRARVSNDARTELEVDLAQLPAGHTWTSRIYMQVGDPAAREVAKLAGYEAVEREGGVWQWRERGVVERVVDFWQNFIAVYREDYAQACDKMAQSAVNPTYLIFDGGDYFDRATRCAFVLREAQQVDAAIRAAQTYDDDVALAAAFRGLRERCVKFLVGGGFRVRSTSAIDNWQVVVEGEMLGRLADRCEACEAFLR